MYGAINITILFIILFVMTFASWFKIKLPAHSIYVLEHTSVRKNMNLHWIYTRQSVYGMSPEELFLVRHAEN